MQAAPEAFGLEVTFLIAREMVATAAQECLIRPIGSNRQAIEAAQKVS